jgi:hypothetical protein
MTTSHPPPPSPPPSYRLCINCSFILSGANILTRSNNPLPHTDSLFFSYLIFPVLVFLSVYISYKDLLLGIRYFISSVQCDFPVSFDILWYHVTTFLIVLSPCPQRQVFFQSTKQAETVKSLLLTMAYDFKINVHISTAVSVYPQAYTFNPILHSQIKNLDFQSTCSRYWYYYQLRKPLSKIAYH